MFRLARAHRAPARLVHDLHDRLPVHARPADGGVRRGRASRTRSASCYLRPLIYLGYGALGLGSLEPPVRTMVACYEWGAYLGDDGPQEGHQVHDLGVHPRELERGDEQGQDLRPVRDVGARQADGEQERLRRGADARSAGLRRRGHRREHLRRQARRGAHAALSSAILAGITRDTTIQLLREHGVEVREEAIARDELYIADEVFLTGTAAEITPVREIDHRKIGRGEAGPVTRRLSGIVLLDRQGLGYQARPLADPGVRSRAVQPAPSIRSEPRAL